MCRRRRSNSLETVTTTSRWIELDGAANVRDVGGLSADGGVIRPNRLIRSDNLQGLSARDVRELVDQRNVRAVADLRTDVEVKLEGAGPMHAEPLVAVHHYSLFPEFGENTDVAVHDDGAPILPWQERDTRIDPDDPGRRGASGAYRLYLEHRPDSIVNALRLIASTDGATIVHCAAGKDRTGVVVALALAEVGVAREAIFADYALSADRIDDIFARLRASETYASDLANQSVDKHAPRESTMRRVFATLDAEHGGPRAWLRANGWTEADAEALRSRLLD
jgi:protein tyrosine/serine phosphatase